MKNGDMRKLFKFMMDWQNYNNRRITSWRISDSEKTLFIKYYTEFFKAEYEEKHYIPKLLDGYNGFDLLAAYQ